MQARLVQQLLSDSAEKSPEKLALVCDGERYTYGQIEAAANAVAHGLRELGVARGDRVVLHLPNTYDLVVGIFATLKAGGVFVVANSMMKPDKLSYIASNCGAVGLFTWQAKANLIPDLLGSLESLKFAVLSSESTGEELPAHTVALDALIGSNPTQPPAEVNIDRDLACLIYTSGSTGEAKGVMSDHSNVIFAVRSITSYLDNEPEDIVINLLPLSFDYGLYQLLMTFGFGGTLILERGFLFPAQILKRIEEERVTGLPGVPTVFSSLLSFDLSEYDLSSLRYLTNTAAALPVSHIKQLRKAFPQADLYSMYGLTETKRTLYLPPDQLERRPDSVGLPIPGTEVWLEDEVGNRLGPGKIGELVVRGRHVMRGYWGEPAMTDARYRPGPLPGEFVCYTGDLFRMDEEGYYYFVGRTDDIIKSRGEKVAPKEVENVLYQLPGVLEAAVIGVDDPVVGESIKAFVVVDNEQVAVMDILAHCRNNLEPFMVPESVEIRTELPKTTSGKIAKRELA